MVSLYVSESVITRKTPREHNYALGSTEVQLVRHHCTNMGMLVQPCLLVGDAVYAFYQVMPSADRIRVLVVGYTIFVYNTMIK
ncbi:hypothetical protein ACFLTP_08225 [Chloroflexota bacterium]